MSVANKLGENHSSDLNTITKIGSDYETAEQDYNIAVQGGKDKEIGAAQLELNKKQEQFAAFMATKKQEHDLIMQLIQMIGR